MSLTLYKFDDLGKVNTFKCRVPLDSLVETPKKYFYCFRYLSCRGFFAPDCDLSGSLHSLLFSAITSRTVTGSTAALPYPVAQAAVQTQALQLGKKLAENELQMINSILMYLRNCRESYQKGRFEKMKDLAINSQHLTTDISVTGFQFFKLEEVNFFRTGSKVVFPQQVRITDRKVLNNIAAHDFKVQGHRCQVLVLSRSEHLSLLHVKNTECARNTNHCIANNVD